LPNICRIPFIAERGICRNFYTGTERLKVTQIVIESGFNDQFTGSLSRSSQYISHGFRFKLRWVQFKGVLHAQTAVPFFASAFATRC